MRFSLATLATVALATQTATADWLSGKAGKSSLTAWPIGDAMISHPMRQTHPNRAMPKNAPSQVKHVLTDGEAA